MRKNIAILGGGISGLTTAFFLLKKIPGISIHLYEKSLHVGGALSSHKTENAWLEMGPSSIRKSQQINEIMKIISEANLLPKIIPSTDYAQVYLYYDEKMRVFPRSFKPSTVLNFAKDNKKFISSFFKPKLTKTLNAKDPKIDLSIKELIEKTARFRYLDFKELQGHLHQISGALFNGIYASDISELSSKICWEKCHHDLYYSKFFTKKEYKEFEPETQKVLDQYLSKSSSFTFHNGLNTLPKGILTYLEEKYPNNFKLLKGEEVLDLDLKSQHPKINGKDSYDMVISALPLPNILSLLSGNENVKNSKTFKSLESIKFKSLARINFYFDKDLIPENLQSFGFLILPKEKEEVLGMTFDSRVFPINENETRCSVMIGNEIVEKYDFDEKQLMKIAERCLEKKLGINERAKEKKFVLWKKYMPLFGVGHFEKMLGLLEELPLLNKNFKITGNFVFSAAIPEITLFNYCLTESIKKKFDDLKN